MRLVQHLIICATGINVTFCVFGCAAELGDYSEEEHPAGYLSEYCFIPNPPQDFHKEVAKHHQQHRYLYYT